MLFRLRDAVKLPHFTGLRSQWWRGGHLATTAEAPGRGGMKGGLRDAGRNTQVPMAGRQVVEDGRSAQSRGGHGAAEAGPEEGTQAQ